MSILGAALGLMPWVPTILRLNLGQLTATIDVGRFTREDAQTLLWKGGRRSSPGSESYREPARHADARAALSAFAGEWPNLGERRPACNLQIGPIAKKTRQVK